METYDDVVEKLFAFIKIGHKVRHICIRDFRTRFCDYHVLENKEKLRSIVTNQTKKILNGELMLLVSEEDRKYLGYFIEDFVIPYSQALLEKFF